MTTTINIRTLRVSEHARKDRWVRITKSIEALGGIGEILLVCQSNKAKYTESVVSVVTSTGMIFVIDTASNLLITAYPATIRMTMGLYGSCGYTRMPQTLYQKISYNQRYLSHIYSY